MVLVMSVSPTSQSPSSVNPTSQSPSSSVSQSHLSIPFLLSQSIPPLNPLPQSIPPLNPLLQSVNPTSQSPSSVNPTSQSTSSSVSQSHLSIPFLSQSHLSIPIFSQSHLSIPFFSQSIPPLNPLLQSIPPLNPLLQSIPPLNPLLPQSVNPTSQSPSSSVSQSHLSIPFLLSQSIPPLNPLPPQSVNPTSQSPSSVNPTSQSPSSSVSQSHLSIPFLLSQSIPPLNPLLQSIPPLNPLPPQSVNPTSQSPSSVNPTSQSPSSVIIEGFRSYREQTVIEPFHPGHNVIVGRNGSGKSNFFAAIQFVLGDEFTQLRVEQRQSLLHQSFGPRVITAYVEIIFDNTDGRIPIDDKKVHLRRTIGTKKDQFLCNKKKMTRLDVTKLFESAGFSRANPYYIVKQGKINQLATASDAQRLKILQEVAGVTVYDEKADKCKREMKEWHGKHEGALKLVTTTEDRLKTMEEDCKELKEYQKLDKVKRGLEYAIYERHLKEMRKQLEDMEVEHQTFLSKKRELPETMKETQESLKTVSENRRDIKSKLSRAEEEMNTHWNEQQQLLKDKTKLELTLRYLEDEVKGDSNSKTRMEKELDKLQDTITRREQQLETVKPQYKDMKARMETTQNELSVKKQKIKELYAKQGRGRQFTTKEERDQWIHEELKSVDWAITETKPQIEQLGKSDYQRKEINLEQNIRTLKEELARAEHSLRSFCSKSILCGCDSVQKVLATFREQGGHLRDMAEQYCGLVVDKIGCERSLYTAVEVTANNRRVLLFHHIVNSEKVATAILREMNKQELPGQVTFLPLDKLKVKDINYPNSTDMVPMIDKLQYSGQFNKAIKSVFGQTLICRNLDSATQLARAVRLECVTLEGHQVSSRGVLTGGYINPSRSRLEAHKLRSQLRERVASAEAELTKLQDAIVNNQQEINTIVSDIQKNDVKDNKTKNLYEKLENEAKLLKKEQSGIDRTLQPLERYQKQLMADLEAMKVTKEGLEMELHQELTSTFTVQEQEEVDQLNEGIRTLTQDYNDIFKQRMKLEEEKNKLEIILKNNLYLKKDELLKALQKFSMEDHKRQLERTQKVIGQVNSKIDAVIDRYKAAEKKVLEHQEKEKSIKSKLEDLEGKLEKLKKQMEEKDKELEKMTSQQILLQHKIDDCFEKVRNLGPLPCDVLEKYQNIPSKKLFRELDTLNVKLKKYADLNQIALVKYSHCSDQKKKFDERLELINQGYEKVLELRNSLERCKCDSVQFTFNQVSQFFTQVFSELAPQGSAHLVMIEDDSEPREQGTVESLLGVGIKVSFTGKNADIKEMNQLSGGQKSLVALTLIFAMQRCNPAPFYIFDEIDQALDSQHRKSVADMIHKLSHDAQFITTTFRPELLTHAHKYYGVRFQNKVSHLESIDKEEAYNFMEEQLTL
ncbi:hypothetical protein Pmani_007859 [Petrolisthes manimaculis]|uniref:Structural maintenance of chromosomes protein n=1 Tax=Petrolisthes manimaculis TaxID=1843537 RepID=A0AAE1UED3_9EUCA|nr:hypothetical protein Pmani_007859 [Petrolisthes manimaculis]